jgi:hypothetical protein
MSMTASVRVAHKSPSLAKGQRHHDTRESHVPAYVDRDRSDLNSTVIKPMAEAELRQVCLDRRATRGTKRAMKKDAAIATIGIITFGKEAQPVIEALSVADQDALYLEAAKRIAQELKSDVSGLVVHRDESAPHAHFQMPAYNAHGVPLSKVMTPSVAKKMQDIVGEVYAKHGISRGKPKAQRIADGEGYDKTVNRSVKRLHTDIPLEIEIEEKKMAAARHERELEEKGAAAARHERESEEKKLADIKIAQAAITSEIASSPPPAMPAAKTIEVKTGVMKSISMIVYDVAEVSRWAQMEREWAKTTFTKTNIEMSNNLSNRDYEIQKKEDSWGKIDDAINRLDSTNAEVRALKLEQQAVGRRLGDIAGVTNASMNAGKTYRIFADGNFKSLGEFQQALTGKRVELSLGAVNKQRVASMPMQ